MVYTGIFISPISKTAYRYSGHQELFCRAGGRQRSTPDVASQWALHWPRRCSLNPAGHALSLVLSIEHRFPSDGDAEFIQLCQILFLPRKKNSRKKTALALSICGCCISKCRTGPWKSPPTCSPVLSRPSPLHHNSPATTAAPEPPSPTSSLIDLNCRPADTS